MSLPWYPNDRRTDFPAGMPYIMRKWIDTEARTLSEVARLGSVGGEIEWAPTTIEFADTLVLSESNLRIKGNGDGPTFIQANGAGNGITVTAQGRVALERFYLNSTKGQHGISFEYPGATTAFRHSVKHVDVVGFLGNGVQSLNDEFLELRRVTAYANQLNGFYLSNTANTSSLHGVNCRMTQCRAMNNYQIGIDVAEQQGAELIQCEVLSNGQGNSAYPQAYLEGSTTQCVVRSLDAENGDYPGVGSGLKVAGGYHDVHVHGVSLATGVELSYSTHATVRRGYYSSVTTPVLVDTHSTNYVVYNDESITIAPVTLATLPSGKPDGTYATVSDPAAGKSNIVVVTGGAWVYMDGTAA